MIETLALMMAIHFGKKAIALENLEALMKQLIVLTRLDLMAIVLQRCMNPMRWHSIRQKTMTMKLIS